MELRHYQQSAIDELMAWFDKNPNGNPCLELPTGAGKSHVIASLCKNIIQEWPDQRIVMITHVKELIEQNAQKMRQHWPNAPMGIYSASLKRRQLSEAITFAGIQSIRLRAADVGHVDLIIIDECHLVGHKDEGSYRKFINDLMEINPSLRVIGLTATPYRLGHGLITEKPALFDAIISPVSCSIQRLVADGFLAPLRSKSTTAKLSVEGVGKRGGEYIESELQKAVDNSMTNQEVVTEIIERAGDRRSWLIFCTGIHHSYHIRDLLIEYGIRAETITGDMPMLEREKIIRDYRSGEITALTNANVLTTGFDAPDTDLIAFLRPTISPGLYVQMAGRGMRLKSHTDHCLVLDFAGNVEFHGPITAVEPPSKKGNGVAPIKECPECKEIVHASTKVCPVCGFEFPGGPQEQKTLRLSEADIMGNDEDVQTMDVSEWSWLPHVSRTSGKEMLRVTYYGPFNFEPVTEYLPVTHEGYAGDKARRLLASIVMKAEGDSEWLQEENMTRLAQNLESIQHPHQIEYTKDGKFHRIVSRMWS
jgi:DNA repair protein RadD